MKMHRSEVFGWTTSTNSIAFARVVIWGGIWKLRFILFVLLLNWSSMRRCFGQARILTIKNNILAYTGSSLVDLDLTSSHAAGYNMLSCLLTILHVCYLSWSLASSLSHSLDCGNYLLVVLSSLSRLIGSLPFRFVDLQFENPIIGPSSSSIWTSTDWSISLVVKWSLPCRLVRHFGLCTLGGVNTAVHWSCINWPMRCILIPYLQFLKALIHVGALSILRSVTFYLNFLAAVSRRVTLWAVACLSMTTTVMLVLYLRMEFPKLNLLSVITNLSSRGNSHLHLVVLVEKHFHLVVWLLQLSLRYLNFPIDSSDFTILLV